MLITMRHCRARAEEKLRSRHTMGISLLIRHATANKYGRYFDVGENTDVAR